MSNESARDQDIKMLKDLNEKIGQAESAGDRDWLVTVLAPRLAFQRADGLLTVDDQDAFLWKIKAGEARHTEIIEPIEFFGNRAVVQCVVTLGKRHFHNLRLFVKRDGSWKLLGWANEEATKS